MTNLNGLIEIARRNGKAITRLESLLVPLAAGWMSSDGTAIKEPVESIKKRLLLALDAAETDIRAIRQEVN